jgi:AAA15 family ATPase/GTPase
VFIGYPNVGKSAILEAVSILSYLQPDYKESVDKLCRIKSANEIFFNANIKRAAKVVYSEKVETYLNYISESSLSVHADIYSEKRVSEGAGNPWEDYKWINFDQGKTN